MERYWIVLAVIYFAIGVAMSVVVLRNREAGMVGLGDTFWYRVLQVSVVIWIVVLGPVAVGTFVALYAVIGIIASVVNLFWKAFCWFSPYQSLKRN